MVYRESREVRALNFIATAAYYVAWVVTAVLLMGIPAIRLLSDRVTDESFTIDVPVTITELDAGLVSSWLTEARDLPLNDLHGDLEIPIVSAPVSFLVVTWLGLAVSCGLALLILHQIRRLVQRVRAGAPFDSENAGRLRTLARLILVRYVFKAFYVFFVSGWVATTITGSVQTGSMPYANWSVILIALVLMALAEIFRRGTALEDEQSLVV